MQFVKVIIPGKFFDSQLYSGILYLWDTSGDIHIYNWDKLISLIPIDDNLRIMLEGAFLRSDFFYGDRWARLFADEDIKNVIKKKFDELSGAEVVVSTDLLEASKIYTQRNPMPFPHSDLILYKKEFFVSGEGGVFKSSCNKKNKNHMNLKPHKVWDNDTVFGLSASYGNLAMACGSEGLYERSVDSYSFRDRDFFKLSSKHSSSVRWVYYDVYASSHNEQGYLADFGLEKNAIGKDERKFRGVVGSEEIFENTGYSWGLKDKLCQLYDRTISIVSFNPWDKDGVKFRPIGQIELMPFKGDVVFCDAASFGYLIECDNGLVVINSQLENIWLPGEPVNWRVFPRSRFYENQLHIVYPEALHVLSFNDDYFVNQNTKLAGIKVSPFYQTRREVGF